MYKEAFKAVKKKHSTYIHYLIVRSSETWLQYKKQRNLCSRIIKKSVVDYEHSIAAESKNNHKAVYKYVNSKLKSKDPVRHLLKRDGTLTTTDKEKADVLNEQFSSVFTKENMLNFPDITSHQLRTEPLTTHNKRYSV